MNDILGRPVLAAPAISIAGLGKTYEDGGRTIPVLREVDLEVTEGEMVSIVGPSGSGKSTLLMVLGLLQPPTTGSYRVQGRDVLGLDRRGQAEFRRYGVGFIFQSCNLVENSTVYENLEFPLMYAGVKRADRRDRILDALARVGLEHRLDHRTNRLSGGEQQRVAIARALVNHPRIILADEPTGQLDRDNGRQVMARFEQAMAATGTTVVIVTHDLEVAAHCTRSYRLDSGELREQAADVGQ